MASKGSLLRLAERENRRNVQIDRYSSMKFSHFMEQAGPRPALCISEEADQRVNIITSQVQMLPYFCPDSGFPVIIITNNSGSAKKISQTLSNLSWSPSCNAYGEPTEQSIVVPMSEYHLLRAMDIDSFTILMSRWWSQEYGGVDANKAASYCRALLNTIQTSGVPLSFQAVLNSLSPTSVDPEQLATRLGLTDCASTLKDHSMIRTPLFNLCAALGRSTGLSAATDNDCNLIMFANRCVADQSCRTIIIPVCADQDKTCACLAEEIQNLIHRSVPFALIVDDLPCSSLKDVIRAAQRSPLAFVSVLVSDPSLLDEEMTAGFPVRILSVGNNLQTLQTGLKFYGQYQKLVLVQAGHKGAWNPFPWERSDGWNIIQVQSDRLTTSEVRTGQVVVCGHNGSRIALCNRLIF